ncbi:Huntington interacting protein related 1 [Dirofilaria immitis]|nr:Huntington interacting protein related 1 [Dirofilaria immitis]
MSLKSVVLGDDREASIKHQIVSVHKALNKNEVPLKQKHARQVIVGTHKEKSCALFWSCISRIQLEKNPVISWKFCHLLHKLIQDGHRKVLEESVRYKTRIEALGNFWYHLENSDYGRPNSSYCKMLVSRLEFHNRNHSIPGNLRLSANQVQALANADVNQSFELSVEMLDQMDDLLALQAAVLRKVDNVNWSSMVPQGQCMLSPLILIILDTSKFYDHLVKLIFKLHSKLPPDALFGHRSRFNSIFHQTKEFYETSTNLQYFKFLASELESYQAPNAYLHGDNVSETDTPPDERSVTEESLVDVVEAGLQNSSDHMDSKDTIIEALRRDVEDARYHNERLMNEVGDRFLKTFNAAGLLFFHRLQFEARARIEQYEKRLVQAQQENDHYKQTLDEVKGEVDRLRELTLTRGQQRIDEARLLETEQKAQSSELNYQKMKNAYTNLRQEHIEVIFMFCVIGPKEITSCQMAKQNSEKTISNMEERMAELEQESIVKDEKVQDISTVVGNLQKSLTERESELQELKQTVEQIKAENISSMEQMEKTSEAKLQTVLKSLFSNNSSLCEVYSQILKQSCEDLQNALSITYPNQLVLPALRLVVETTEKAMNEVDAEPDNLFRLLTFLGHHLADVLLNSAAAANVVSIQHFQIVQEQCCIVITDAIAVYSVIGNLNLKSVKELFVKLKSSLEKLEHICLNLPAGSNDVTAEVIGAELEQEMKRMDAAIQKAVELIEEMQKKSRATDSGIRLKVNEGILDSCNQLMTAVVTLVTKSRALQEEIVASGNDSSNPNEFYKRNHQWTEGLLSAARAVGVAATVLVQRADDVVSCEGKLEYLIVASQEIAASTAQLFVSSRVKADRESQRLRELSAASSSVNTCTANVVATVKNAQITLNEQKEMESQVRILELEDKLIRERTHLAKLRKQHYQLAQIIENDSASADK